MTKKKAAPAAPVHDCGHEIWVHSKRSNAEPWRCTEAGCNCKSKLMPRAA